MYTPFVSSLNLLRVSIVFLTIVFAGGITVQAADLDVVAFNTDKQGEMPITIGGKPFALYVYEDSNIHRPYFAHVRVPSGIQVTRNHPPIEGLDLTDHGTYHPGIWMSFGDISGSDYWRNQAHTEHVACLGAPKGGPGKGTFTVRNRYLDQNDKTKVVCEELGHFTILVRPAGTLLLWDATFSSDHEFYFGDQEEMGIGFRVATPIRVEKKSKRFPNVVAGNGTILDAKGRKNGEAVWGNASDWCDYSGTLDDQHVGILLMCHPENFRPSWFHARDYGLLEANPFGRDAFGKGEKSKVVIKPGENMHLRYGLFLHSGPKGSTPDLPAMYKDYLSLADK